MAFVGIKMGRRQGGPSRTGGRSGAYLDRYVTDEQRSRRPIFIETLQAWGSHVIYGTGHQNQSSRDRAARDTSGLHLFPQLSGESVSEFCLPRLRLER